MGEFSNKESKEVAIGLGAFGNAIVDAYEDGKLQWQDAVKFIKVIGPMRRAIDGIDQVPKEAADYSPEERQEIYDTFKRSFELRPDNPYVEQIADNAFAATQTFVALVNKIKLAREWQVLN